MLGCSSDELDVVDAEPAVAAPVVGGHELDVVQVPHAVAAAALERVAAVVDLAGGRAAVPGQVVGPAPVVVCWVFRGVEHGGAGQVRWGCALLL